MAIAQGVRDIAAGVSNNRDAQTEERVALTDACLRPDRTKPRMEHGAESLRLNYCRVRPLLGAGMRLHRMPERTSRAFGPDAMAIRMGCGLLHPAPAGSE